MTWAFHVWTDSLGPLRVVWVLGDGTADACRYPRLNLGHRIVCDGIGRCVLCGGIGPGECPENEYEHLLYCRSCGETKRLNKAKAKAAGL